MKVWGDNGGSNGAQKWRIGSTFRGSHPITCKNPNLMVQTGLKNCFSSEMVQTGYVYNQINADSMLCVVNLFGRR